MSAEISDMFWRAPPVTRTIVAAMFVESALVYGGLLNPYRILFRTSSLFKFPPELWRLMSAFLLTGPRFNFVFDLYFMWTYGSGLELNSPRFSTPGDFFTFVVFVTTFIVVTAGFVLKSYIFTNALLMAFVYIFAQDNRGTKAHFVVIQIPIALLPFAMLTLSLLLDGPNKALMQVTGLLAAHLYDFLTRLYPTFQGGRNYIQTPAAIRRYFGADRAQSTTRAYGQATRPGQVPPAQQQQGRGWTSGFSSNAWAGRGTGRRLGD